MLLDAATGVHLTYCTNIHPGESWPEVRAAVLEHGPAVRARVAPDRPFGIGLRLSAAAAEALAAPAELEAFAAELRARDLYVFTLNGFPYGPFHGQPVKEAVYRPDWTEPARAEYTDRLAEILAALLPPHAGGRGSISTVPGCFRPRGDRQAVTRMADQLVDRAARLWVRHERGGPRLELALEPEPACWLETTAEAIAFFEEHLLSAPARERFARATGVSPSQAEPGLRRHLGVCLDACHAAVELEDPRACVRSLLAAGISIAKVQVTTGLQLDPPTPSGVEALAAFADPVYLHQVVVDDPRGPRRFVDLPPALEAFTRGEVSDGAWRVHFHVPVFQRRLAPFDNTQPFLKSLLDEVRATNASPHLEVETYTFDVLPPEHRALGVDDAIARELGWTIDTWQSEASGR